MREFRGFGRRPAQTVSPTRPCEIFNESEGWPVMGRAASVSLCRLRVFAQPARCSC